MNSPFWRLNFKYPEGNTEFPVSATATASGIQKACRHLSEERKKERNRWLRGKEGKEGVLYAANKNKKKKKEEEKKTEG